MCKIFCCMQLILNFVSSKFSQRSACFQSLMVVLLFKIIWHCFCCSQEYPRTAAVVARVPGRCVDGTLWGVSVQRDVVCPPVLDCTAVQPGATEGISDVILPASATVSSAQSVGVERAGSNICQGVAEWTVWTFWDASRSTAWSPNGARTQTADNVSRTASSLWSMYCSAWTTGWFRNLVNLTVNVMICCSDWLICAFKTSCLLPLWSILPFHIAGPVSVSCFFFLCQCLPNLQATFSAESTGFSNFAVYVNYFLTKKIISRRLTTIHALSFLLSACIHCIARSLNNEWTVMPKRSKFELLNNSQAQTASIFLQVNISHL